MCSQPQAFDRDMGDNAVIRYSLFNGNRDLFDLDEVTGSLSTHVSLDLTVSPEYELTIVAYNPVPYQLIDQPENDTLIVNIVIEVGSLLSAGPRRSSKKCQIYKCF